MKNIKYPVLVAIYSKWYEMEHLFAEKEIPTIIVYSKQEFLQLLDSQKVSAFVAISDWVVEDANTPSLVEKMKGELPTVTICTEKSKQRFGPYLVFDKTIFRLVQPPISNQLAQCPIH